MSPTRYDHRTIEKKWQERWERDKVFSVSGLTPGHSPQLTRGVSVGRGEAYVLDMFPYPSGDGLHVGHPEGYTATDIYARYLRMNGKKVLHPMGWDAFGLPTENAAIKKGVHPRDVTEQNIATFKRQIKSLGFSYDWDREVNTTDPKYYKWTQWIFLQLFKRGLAYEKEAPIWWCPKDKTGLANEEVVNGKCDRCGTTVEKKMLKQWMLKITAYADRLLEGLNKLDWPEGIKTLQRNWIGKSEGAEVTFDINETQKVKRIVILHGRSSTSLDHFYPKLKQDLEVKGFTVEVPNMPIRNGEPDDDEQTDFVLKNCSLDQQTVIVGHSFGGIVALRLLERGVKVNGVVLVATPFSGEFSDHVSRPTVTAAAKKGFKFATIKKNSGYFEVIGGTNDTAVPLADSTSLAERLGVKATHVSSTKPHFQSENEPSVMKALIPSITVFTTRPDTLFGATYLVLSPEHELVKQITTEKQKKAVENYVKSVAAKSDIERTSLEKEKSGVFTGAFAENPISKQQIPIWIADYVLSSYGTGAIMAVPAHDERDFAFAKKYKLPIVSVVTPPAPPLNQGGDDGGVWTGEGTLIHSGTYNGMSSEEARDAITSWLESQDFGRGATQYKLRDWVFSRQRYWGEPIPLVHCENCKETVESTKWVLNFYQRPWRALQSGEKTVETRALNPDEPNRFFGHVAEGDVIKGVLKGTDEEMFLRVTKRYVFKNLEDLHTHKDVLSKLRKNFSPSLAELKKFYALTPDYVDRIEKNGLVAWEVERIVPGIVAVPEDQLPVQLPNVEKYQPSGTGESPLSGITDWVNTTCPNCEGPAKRETNTMPQWAGSCWYYLRFCDPHNEKEFASAEALKTWLPVDLYVGGAEHAVLHLLYARFWHMILFDAGFIPLEVGDEPFQKLKNQGLILGPDGEKMSKSRGNVINPDEIVTKYGADTFRMYEMFMGPFEDAKPWDTNGILGVRRFLDKVWRAQGRVTDTQVTGYRKRLLHTCIKLVTNDIEQFKFNTAVSAFMGWSNEWSQDRIPKPEFEIFLKLLASFAPHVAEELWNNLGHKTLICEEVWPKYDQSIIDTPVSKKIVIQINGKLRGTITVPPSSDQEVIEKLAKAEPNAAKYLIGEPKKVIFVKDKLINFVI